MGTAFGYHHLAGRHRQHGLVIINVENIDFDLEIKKKFNFITFKNKANLKRTDVLDDRVGVPLSLAVTTHSIKSLSSRSMSSVVLNCPFLSMATLSHPLVAINVNISL